MTLGEVAALVAIATSIAGPIATLKILGWRVKKIEDEIGTKDSGMRKQLHEHAGILQQHEMRIGLLEREQ